MCRFLLLHQTTPKNFLILFVIFNLGWIIDEQTFHWQKDENAIFRLGFVPALFLTGRGRSVGGFKLIWINWLLIFSWRGFRYEEDFHYTYRTCLVLGSVEFFSAANPILYGDYFWRLGCARTEFGIGPWIWTFCLLILFYSEWPK
jgi:hypothetical protein